MKNNRADESRASELNALAAEWVIKQEHGLSPAEQDAFNDWLAQGPQNKQAYLAHLRSWEELDRLVGLQKSMHRPPNPDLLDEEWILGRGKRTLAKRFGWICGLAACLLVAALFFGSWLPNEDSPEPVAAHIPERIQRMQLDDGSTIALNRGARVSVEFSASERLVRLRSGEANFQVAKDSQRPFVVATSVTRVQAVGTVFNVRSSSDSIDVLVTEGLVAVEPATVKRPKTGDSATAKTFIKANERATVSGAKSKPNVTIVQMKPHEVQNELLWQPKLMEFEDAPLSEIVSAFNRHNPVRLRVESQELNQLRLSSIFWSDNVAGFVRLLELKYGISAVPNKNGSINLRKPNRT